MGDGRTGGPEHSRPGGGGTLSEKVQRGNRRPEGRWTPPGVLRVPPTSEDASVNDDL